MGLFPCVSRLNHSCAPNTAPSFKVDPGGAVQTVRAVRAIARGTEVFASFVGLLTGRSARQAKLTQMHFAGGCRCARCDAEAAAPASHPLDTLRCRCEAAAPLAHVATKGGACGGSVPCCPICRAEHPAASPLSLLKLVEDIETRGAEAQLHALRGLSCEVPASHWASVAVAEQLARERVWGGQGLAADAAALRVAVSLAEEVCPDAWPPLTALRMLAAGAEAAAAGALPAPAAAGGAHLPTRCVALLSAAAAAHHTCFSGGTELFAARYAAELAILRPDPSQIAV